MKKFLVDFQYVLIDIFNKISLFIERILPHGDNHEK
jgi:hypothetical protein